MSAEAILTESWQLFKRHWRYLGVIAAINFLVTLALSVAITVFGLGSFVTVVLGGARSASWLPAALGVLGVLLVAAALLAPILSGASMLGSLRAIKGKTGSPLDPYRATLAQYGRLAAVLAVSGGAVFVGLVCLVVPGILAAIAFAPALYLAVTTTDPVGRVLARSIELGRAQAGTIALLLLALGAGSFAISFAVSHLPVLGPVLAGFVNACVGAYSTLALAVFGAKAAPAPRRA